MSRTRRTPRYPRSKGPSAPEATPAGQGTASPPAQAPVSPPAQAPVSPPAQAPVSPPAQAPVSPPAQAPVSPPEAAPLPHRATAPAEALAPGPDPAPTSEWDRIRALPRVGEVWAGVRVPAQTDIPDAAAIDICMWADMSGRAPRTYATIPRSSPAGELARLLLEAIVNPMGSAPVGRPRGVLVAPRAERECLGELLAALDIACEDVRDEDVFDMMEIEGQPVAMVPDLALVPGLGQGAGMEQRELEWFYGAAAEFWEAAPWRFTDHESLVRLDGVLPDGPLYASLLGAGSRWRGLTLFFDEAAAHEMGRPRPDLRVLQQSLVLRVLFVAPHECGTGPLEDARRLGWKTPADDVYPMIVRWHPQPLYGLPAPEELLFASMALRFIAVLPFEGRKDFEASTTMPDGRRLQAAWPASVSR